jgi:hypothetical protein
MRSCRTRFGGLLLFLPIRHALGVLSIAAVVAGCTFDDKGATSGGSGAGNRIGPGMGAGGLITGREDGGEVNPDGGNCGVAMVPLAKLPPDLLLVLDRSRSMNQNVAGTDCGNMAGCVTKWAEMTAGLNQVLASTQDTVNWGLKFFSSTGDCGMNNNAEVPIAANNAAAMTAAIGGTGPTSATPTRAAMDAAVTYLRGVTTANPKFIVLATDGLPTCGSGGNTSGDGPNAIAAVTRAAAAGYQTFVVGIATTGTDGDATLTSMAQAGLRPRAGSPSYYPVASRQELVDTFNTIESMVNASCSFTIGVPPDPNNVGVRADGARIPKDLTHMNGWDYGPGMTSVVVFGSYCDSIMAGDYTSIQAIFGCPGVIVE